MQQIFMGDHIILLHWVVSTKNKQPILYSY